MLQTQLTAFFERVNTDMRLTPFHISLYLALLHQWNSSRFSASFPLIREDLLPYSRIGSNHTFYRCLKDLNGWGYLTYTQSRSSKQPSTIAIAILVKPASSGPKPNPKPTTTGSDIPPTIEEVKAFFTCKSYPEMEAQKFFNHFQSNGWRVGGKSPMRNWYAAADNWILNSHNYQRQPVQQSLNLINPKSYDDPL
jgi:hypothetical protein